MWTVRFKRRAEKAIAAMHPQDRMRVTKAIELLAVDPHQAKNVKPLAGEANLRLRVGGFRVIYTLENDLLIVVVIDAGPRGGIY